jgi:hypothetical protein
MRKLLAANAGQASLHALRTYRARYFNIYTQRRNLMVISLRLLAAISAAFIITACGGLNSNPQPNTPSEYGNQKIDAYKELIIGRWVADCRISTENDFVAVYSTRHEYWFYENEYISLTRHFSDGACQNEEELAVQDTAGGLLYSPIQRAEYKFEQSLTMQDGEVVSSYFATSLDDVRLNPLLNNGWRFNVYIQEGRLYLWHTGPQQDIDLNIDFSQAFHKVEYQ